MTRIALVALVLVQGCATAPVSVSSSAYHLPATIAEFRLEGVDEPKSASGGFVAHYVGPETLRIDVEVSSALNLPFEVSAGDALWTKFRRAVDELDATGMERTSEEPIRIRIATGKADALVAEHRGVGGDRARRLVFTYLTIHGTDFVQARAVGTGAGAANTEGILRTASEALIGALRASGPAPDRREFALFSPHDMAPRMTDGRLSCSAAFESSYGMRLAHLLTRGFYLDTPRRELALRNWAVTVLRHDCDEGEIGDVVTLHRAGFARELVWSHPKPQWGEAKGLDTEAYERFVRERLAGREQLARVPVRIRFQAKGRREGGSRIVITKRPR